jgi:hypothetical protein
LDELKKEFGHFSERVKEMEALKEEISSLEAEAMGVDLSCFLLKF